MFKWLGVERRRWSVRWCWELLGGGGSPRFFLGAIYLSQSYATQKIYSSLGVRKVVVSSTKSTGSKTSASYNKNKEQCLYSVLDGLMQKGLLLCKHGYCKHGQGHSNYEDKMLWRMWIRRLCWVSIQPPRQIHSQIEKWVSTENDIVYGDQFVTRICVCWCSEEWAYHDQTGGLLNGFI